MILDVIVEDKKKRLKEHKARTSEEQMKELALVSERKSISFYEALAKPGLSIIGEFKKASPSMGKIEMTMELMDRIDEYNISVDAISCLTEEDHFLGNTDYFKEIRNISPLPMIRKDFIIDPYQIYEAKVIGASAVLLICSLLNEETLREWITLSHSLGLSALVEAHDEEEIQMAVRAGARIIGVNNRNLKTFEVDINNCIRQRKHIPSDILFVAESGIKSREDVAALEKGGVDGVLIGETLMRSPDKEMTLRQLKGR